MSSRGLLIVGASGRAAAASAIRAGYDPFVIDLFADADTHRLCPVLKCDPAVYPHGFIPLAEKAPASPWMYTGGLENYPEVVEAISQRRELIGFGSEDLRRMRDPQCLDAVSEIATPNLLAALASGSTPKLRMAAYSASSSCRPKMFGRSYPGSILTSKPPSCCNSKKAFKPPVKSCLSLIA